MNQQLLLVVGCWCVVWVCGGVLLSRALAGTVPSALVGLASGFGMGSGRFPTAMSAAHPHHTRVCVPPVVVCGGGWWWLVGVVYETRPPLPLLFCGGGGCGCVVPGLSRVRTRTGVYHTLTRVCACVCGV